MAGCFTPSADHINRLGLVDRHVSVHMPGGIITIEIGDDFAIRMTGSVTKVSEVTISPEIFSVAVA
jgi:diaminopimelate epimerase